MDTKIIREEMCKLDKISGLNTQDIPIRISSRMTRCWGTCHSIKINGQIQIKEIVFAKRLLEYGTVEHILLVVRHEYAHAYVALIHNKAHGHDAIWKQAALKFGCDPKRRVTFNEVNQADNTYKYKVTCQCCGLVTFFHRRVQLVKELEISSDSKHFFCNKCKGHMFTLEVL